jgi:hypothetical protein
LSFISRLTFTLFVLSSFFLIFFSQEVMFRRYGRHYDEATAVSTLLFLPLYLLVNGGAVSCHAAAWGASALAAAGDGGGGSLLAAVLPPLLATAACNHATRILMCVVHFFYIICTVFFCCRNFSFSNFYLF